MSARNRTRNRGNLTRVDRMARRVETYNLLVSERNNLSVQLDLATHNLTREREANGMLLGKLDCLHGYLTGPWWQLLWNRKRLAVIAQRRML